MNATGLKSAEWGSEQAPVPGQQDRAQPAYKGLDSPTGSSSVDAWRQRGGATTPRPQALGGPTEPALPITLQPPASLPVASIQYCQEKQKDQILL